ncbi:hypothetical protein BU15DRAFT_73017 [Melanogaster broomeanus]|nr:hypothetical protein BU15DRAFT_73017 [Melanogaster broomeanus]
MLELKRKPCNKPTTDAHPAKRPKASADTPKTSAHPPKTSSRQNLTGDGCCKFGRIDVIEVESDDEDDPADPPITRANTMLMCQLLECAAKDYGDVEEVLTLLGHLHQFRAKLRRQEFLGAK